MPYFYNDTTSPLFASFSGATAAELTEAVNSFFSTYVAIANPILRSVNAGVGFNDGHTPVSSGSRTRLLTLLKAAAGEASLSSALGRWRRAVADAFETVGTTGTIAGQAWNVTLSYLDDGSPATGNDVEFSTELAVRASFREVTDAADIDAALAECAVELETLLPGETALNVFETVVVGGLNGWLVGLFATRALLA